MKRTLLIGLFLSVLNVGAQDVRLTVQTGHSAGITDMCYSPDGNYIITSGEDNKIIVWDVFTSKQFAALLGHEDAITGIALHPDGNTIVSTSLDSTLRIWDIKSEKSTKTIKLDHALTDVTFNSDGSEFLVGSKHIYRFSYPSLEKKRLPINARKGFTALAYSPDDKYIGIGGEGERKGYLYNDSLNRIEQEYMSKIIDIQFDQDGKSIYYTTVEGHLMQRGIYERLRNATTTDWMLNSINSVALSDSIIFFANDLGEINLIDKEKWLNHRVFINARQKISKIQLSPDKKFLATAGYNRSVVIWDLKKQRPVKVLRGLVNRINDIAFTKDGKEIVVGYADGEVRRTNLLTNISVLNHLKPRTKNILDRGEYSVSRIKEIRGDTVVMAVYFARKSLEHEGAYDKLQEHDVIWDVDKNILDIQGKKHKSAFVKAFIKKSKDGERGTGKDLLQDDLLVTSSQKHDVYCYVDDNEVYVKNYDKTSTKYVIITGHSDLISSICINEKFGFLATASWDGMIRFWDLKSGDLLTVFGAFGKGQYVYLNSDNYYFASKYALDYIGFKFDNRLFSFDQFDLIYNRPDLIVEKLPYFKDEFKQAYFKAYKKRLSKLGVEEKDLELTKNIPMLTVERLDDDTKKKRSQKETLVRFKVKGSDEESLIDKLHVKVNGVPEYGILGKSVGKKEFEEEIVLNLTPGQNYVQFSVVNEQGASSFISSFNISMKDNDAVSNLYVVTIGSGKFEQKQYNLTYADKDSKDIADFFEKNHKGYENCYVKTLVNEEVTRENVKDLKSFLKGAGENDVVLLFAAGHGVLDTELDYYFSSYDIDFDHPEKRGIPYEYFENLMADTKSRKKVMFLDACHSGEIDKDEVIENFVLEEQGDLIFRGLNRSVKNVDRINSFDLSKTLFADMRMNSGTTVISSAGGAEFAIEGAEWDNSVFTFALLSGLKNFDADLNNDKAVRLSELQEFVLFEVSRLTNGMQTPTSRAENLKNDFVLQ